MNEEFMNKKIISGLLSLSVLVSSGFGPVWAGGMIETGNSGREVLPIHLSNLPLGMDAQENAFSLPAEGMEESLQFEDSLGAIQLGTVPKFRDTEASQGVSGSNAKPVGQNLSPANASVIARPEQVAKAKSLSHLAAFIGSHLKKIGARFFDGSKRQSRLSALGLSAFAPSIRPLPKLKLPKGVKTDAGPIIPDFREQPEFHQSLNVVSTTEEPAAEVAAPGVQVFDRLVDVPLAANPQSAGGIERALREAIDSNPQYKVRSSDLGTSQLHLTEVPGQLPTWYASFHQQYTDGKSNPLPVYGASLNFTIHVKNGKPVIVGVHGRLFPKLKVDVSSKFNDAVLESKIKNRLKLQNDESAKISFRDRQIFYVPSSSGKGGAWHAISLYKVEGIDALVAADISTGQTFLWDMRLGAASPTTGPPAGVSSSAQFEARVPTSDNDMGTPPTLHQLPLPGVTVTLPDGREVNADDQGRVNVDLANGQPMDVTAKLESDHVVINNEAGEALVVKASLVQGKDGVVVVFNPPTSVTGPTTPAPKPTLWGKIVRTFKHFFSPSYRAQEDAESQARAESEKELAQVTAYYSHYTFINWAMAHGVGEKDGLLKQKLTINVNIADECNAYYDPSSNTLNFFLSSAQCINTGTLPGVGFHESGHWTHALVASYAHLGLNAMASVDPGLGEGIGDMFATHILSTPLIGEHFFNDPSQSPLPNVPGGALRETTNNYQFNPGDEVHRQGLAFMGTVGYGGAWHSLLGDALGKDKALSLIQGLIFPHIYGYANSADVPAALSVIYLAAKSLTDAAVQSTAMKTLQQAAAKHGMTIPESQSQGQAPSA